MKEFGKAVLWTAVISLGVMLILGDLIKRRTEAKWKKLAYDHGAAVYVVTDPSMGTTEFRWMDELGDNRNE